MEGMSMLLQLGLPGALFVAFFLVAHYGIVEFIKAVGTTVKRKLSRRAPQGLLSPAPIPEGSGEDPFVQGFAVIVLSLLLGAVLGGVMLGGVSGRAGIELPPPFAGVVLGVLLATIVSGWVHGRRKGGQVGTSELLEAFAQALRTAHPSAPPTQVPVPPVTTTTLPVPDLLTPPTSPGPPEFEPVTPADVQAQARPLLGTVEQVIDANQIPR